MTLDEIKNSEKLFLVPAEVAPIIGCKPYSINLQAQRDPAKLGFPVIVLNRRVKIPRGPFLRYVETTLSAT